MTHITRRTLLALSALPLAGCASGSNRRGDLQSEFARIEAQVGGRVGVSALDTGTGHEFRYRAEERFAMCSTFKLLLAASVLAQADAGKLNLEQAVRYGSVDLLAYAPVTSQHLAEGTMSVRALCAAAVELSDNTAANLLLSLTDGPEGLTRFLREAGDGITRIDRREPDLNSNLPGDQRDTSTPEAMTRMVATLLYGDVLKSASRTQLVDWLVASRTGGKRLRAGFDASWKVGDKTGTGDHGAVNDVAIAWPPGAAPVIVTVFMSGSTQPAAQLEQAHADVARAVAKGLAQLPDQRSAPQRGVRRRMGPE